MKRRQFLAMSGLGSFGLAACGLPRAGTEGAADAANQKRKIVIAGGRFGTTFIKYMASLTGRKRPRVCYLPTAAADRDSTALRWYRNCATLDVEPHVQTTFISSYRQKKTFEEVLLSMDVIVVSGGNTLNQQAIWKAQGIDEVLRKAWDQGIVLGGASAGSLCWFEEGSTDSRPKELTKVECLGFLKGSHAPHYDGEKQRRPNYQKAILSGEMKPGYACDNGAGIHFVDNEVKRVVRTRKEAKVYYVSVVDGKIVEKELPSEMIT